MPETHLSPSPSYSMDEIIHSALSTIGASYGRLYLKNPADGVVSAAAAGGSSLTGKEDVLLAEQVLSQNQFVTIDQQDASYALGVPLKVQGETRGALLMRFPATGNGDVASIQRSSLLLARLIEAELHCAELGQTLAQREEHLDQLMRSTIEAQEAEREWICLEVHDGVAQTLASAFQHLQAYEAMPESRLREARPQVLRAAALVRQAIGESREVINSITPAPLSELGLVATLRQELRRFEEDTGCPIQFNAPTARLPRETEVALYRIVHEAVTNVKKHARAKFLKVEMLREHGRVIIRVKDSGVGFDPSQPQGPALGQGRGLGLFSMRKRAEILGGVCEIKSQPGQGTEVIVDVPLLPGRRT